MCIKKIKVRSMIFYQSNVRWFELVKCSMVAKLPVRSVSLTVCQGRRSSENNKVSTCASENEVPNGKVQVELTTASNLFKSCHFHFNPDC